MEKRKGQVVVEMLLILPVFLTMIFGILEIGNIAFWVLVLNHATFESARIGAMQAFDDSSGSGPNPVDYQMTSVMNRFLRGAEVKGSFEPTIMDNQAGIMNHDLVATGSYDVPLVFPISSILLAKPKGTGKRHIEVVLRMPVEQPLPQSKEESNKLGNS
jgi:hypothetical protein